WGSARGWTCWESQWSWSVERSLDRLPEDLWAGFPRREITRFQGGQNISVGVEKDRHIRERIAHRDRLNERPLGDPGRLGGQRRRLLRWQLKRLVLNLVPDGLVDSLGISLAGWEKVHDQEMDALVEKAEVLLHERAEGVRLFLFPGETISMMAMTSPSGWWM